MQLELPPGGLSDGEVAIRAYRAEDAPLLAREVRDKAVRRFAYVRWGDSSADEIAELIRTRWPAAAQDRNVVNVSIRGSATDELVGHFVVFGVDLETGLCEIGFWVLAASRGRGVAPRAVRLFAEWALRATPIRRVQAKTYDDNAASQRVLEKVGFVREGVLRSYYPRPNGGRADSILFSLLPSDL
jgi:RimJ/RimL family protein N-acetyltransferase